MSPSAASAAATANVRLVNAESGGSAVSLRAVAGGRTVTSGSVAFGQVSGFVTVSAGSVKLSLAGGKPASTTATLDRGASYTVVALGASGSPALEVLKDARAKAGQASLRVVHAAPELGSPDIRLGGRVIAQDVKFRAATPYVTVSPGSYVLAVTKPGGTQAIFSKQVSLSPGTATTAVLAGSGGAAAEVILASDSTSAPAGAPKTGLGGLAGGGGAPWLLALLAALCAGMLGGGLQLARARRSR